MGDLAPSSNSKGLLEALQIQRRVIGALLMREILTRYGRSNIGFLWVFVEPMLFTLGVTILWVASRSFHGSSLPIVPFALTGYSSILLWRNAASRCSKAIEPNRSLLFHRNVTVLDLILARVILEVSGATTSFFMLSLVFIATGWMTLPANLLTLLSGWLLMIWFTVGLAMVVGALSEISEGFERTWHIMTYLLFPLSGAVFMVEWLPKDAQKLAQYVPMVNATEMIRDGYYGTIVRTYYDPLYLLVFSSVLVGIGLILVNRLKSVEGGE